MPFASGVYTWPSNTFTPTPTANTTISATDAASSWSDIATALSSCLLKDGSQTVTANIPMGNFKLTGLGAGTANGDSVRYQQSPAGILTTLGDTLYASAANTPARLAAKADVAAHATTSDIWVAREIVLTGSAVTFTDIADAPYVGAVAWVKMNAAHIWTDGAVFDVQGGANYTAAANDWVRIYATTVSTFEVTIFKALGQPVSMQPITNSLSSDVALNNTSNYFDGPTVAQGTAGTWFASGTVTLTDASATNTYMLKLWDGTTVIDSARVTQAAAGSVLAVSLSGYLASPAGNIRISVKADGFTTGTIVFNASGNSKDATVSAIRIA